MYVLSHGRFASTKDDTAMKKNTLSQRRFRTARNTLCALTAAGTLFGVGAGMLGSRSDAAVAIPAPSYKMATIVDTNPTLPANAIYVSNAGSDTNPGTFSQPFATISKALSKAPKGATVVVRGGTYRESLGTIKHPVTLEAYPHEQAWVKGSIVATTFTAGNGVWTTPYTAKTCDNCYPASVVDHDYPAAGLPEQVFVDAKPLVQVTTRSAVTTNTFFVDRAARQIVLGTNPAGHTVEVTVLDSAFRISSAAAGTTIRGIGFADWAATYNNEGAAATSDANNVTLDSDTFAWSASRGLGIYGANNVVSNTHLTDNGNTGMNAFKANGLLFEHNEVTFSNYEHFSIASSPLEQTAGVKITKTTNSIVRDSTFRNNAANALWYDMQSVSQDVVDNTMIHNDGHGIEIEVSGHTIVAGNVVVRNGRDGIKLSGANDVDVWSNTVVNNVDAELGVYEDPRHTTGAATSDTTNVRIGDNILEAGSLSTGPALESFDASSPKHFTTMQMISFDNNNTYGRTDTTTVPLITTQATLTKRGTYTTLAAYQAATHRETTATSIDGAAFTSIFVDPIHGNFTIQPGAKTLLASSTTLPQAVAAALNIPAAPAIMGA
jgi:parallel beta-helix repeat protein